MLRKIIIIGLMGAISGCASDPEISSIPDGSDNRLAHLLKPDLYAETALETDKSFLRNGRYTLVSTLPEVAQRDLMTQIVRINIPANMKPSVHDAMLYLLNRSGYQLCSLDSVEVNTLYTRPLPAAHYQLGPVALGSALQVLAGPAWEVEINEMDREVCYVRNFASTPVPPLSHSGSG